MYYKKSLEGVISKLKSSFNGLSKEDARKRLAQHGYNNIEYNNTSITIKDFIKTFDDPIIMVLLLICTAQLILGELINSAIVVSIILLNSFISCRKIKMLNINEKKNNINTEVINSKVIRDENIVIMPSNQLVIGDVVIVEEGDYIMADGRILHSNDIGVCESVLTGNINVIPKQSKKIKKEVELDEQYNMVFASSIVTQGSGKYIVTSTGMDTEVGKKIIKSNDDIKNYMPFRERLRQFNKVVSLNS